MGCASSKKRTTSVDDLTGGDKKDSSSKKNGQLASKGGAGDASKAVQIPGAHTSFMAPDGIPFIDEDVPDEEAPTRKPDVNRNVVQAEQAKPVAVVAPAASEKSPSLQLEDRKMDELGAEIMKREIEMTQNTTTSTTTTGMCATFSQGRYAPALL